MPWQPSLPQNVGNMPPDKLPDIDALVHKPIDKLAPSRALDHIGKLIDLAGDLRSSAGNDRAFKLLDGLLARRIAPKTAATVHYFRANVWENRRHANGARDDRAWEQVEIQHEILELRKAMQSEGFVELPSMRRCQILTNLANQLSFIGRFIEAAEIRNRAILEDGKFAMALGNQAVNFVAYGDVVYDPGHRSVMHTAAYDLLSASLAKGARYEAPTARMVQQQIRELREKVAESAGTQSARKRMFSTRYSLGKSPAERAYRKWCLANRLFINPLNDLGPLPIAGRDVLTLPSLVTRAPNFGMPWIIGFFNQMKQEYVSARFMYYEGLRAQEVHFSDRDVLLYNTLDYPCHALAVERHRAAFRVAYSIFDKIGFFLNDYLSIGLKPNRVSFRKLWYEVKGERALLPRFVSNPNWPLRGLFWLSKDLFDEELQFSTEPDARALDEMRNHLEHRYLQVHELWASSRAGDTEHRYSISRSDLAEKTLRLLKLSRAALIYLALAVSEEERVNHRSTPGGFVPEIPLDTWDDDWKR
jgi:hypothetical protein